MLLISNKKQFHLILLAIALLTAQNATAQTNQGTGQVITDTNGNSFMEEVIDVNQQKKEEANRKRIRRINRRLLSPQELKNVGVQMAPSGKIIPLINRNPNAPPVRRNRSQLTVEQQPAWMNMPFLPNYPYLVPGGLSRNPRPFLPGQPFVTTPFATPWNYPGIVPYSMYRPYMYRPNIGFGGGFYGMGSRTTITYGDTPQPQVSQEITLPPGGLGPGFLDSFRSGTVPGGHRISGSFFNPFTGSSSMFDSTVKPLSSF